MHGLVQLRAGTILSRLVLVTAAPRSSCLQTPYYSVENDHLGVMKVVQGDAGHRKHLSGHLALPAFQQEDVLSPLDI